MKDLELLASIGADLPVIDLHISGTITDALITLDQELARLSLRHVSACRVIYGIGEGKMRAAVLQELKKHPLVRGIQEEVSGGSAIIGL